MLGHKTTKTTETYYCRRTNDSAIAVAQKAGATGQTSSRLCRAIHP
ncbi:MAG: hypothetical protein H5T41_02240 [Methanomassiliicoccales archaeon]|nr:hypothetical protein [Methanomassiliicoccales archaeon]